MSIRSKHITKRNRKKDKSVRKESRKEKIKCRTLKNSTMS